MDVSEVEPIPQPQPQPQAEAQPQQQNPQNPPHDAPAQVPPKPDIMWFYQDGTDPWKEKNPKKFKWRPYPAEISAKIEAAFILSQSPVEYETYSIDLTKMLQYHKKDYTRARRVKREIIDISQHRLLEEIPIPTSIEKEQKTANRAFGNVKHFLNYIMKRTPEAYLLYQKLSKLKLDALEDEYKDIVEGVITCIQKAAQTKQEIIMTRQIQQGTDYILQAESVINEIKASPKTLKDFLRTILRVYTMESFVCYWLNELLRCENWEDINVLTPYLVCLTYTFQLEEYIVGLETNRGLAGIWDLIKKPKLVLYRGTALIPEHLDYYDMKKIDFFSWNAVTSTSRNKDQALKFVQISMNNAWRQNQVKSAVLFIIDTDYASVEDCEGMIDISKFSRFPGEEEIVLVPGTVFKLVGKKEIGPNFYQVNLEIKKKFEKDQKEVALLGALQQKVIFKDLAIFDGLQREEMIMALQLLEGNQLIKKLEIKNISIDSHLRVLVEYMRRTTNLEKKNYKLINTTIFTDSLCILNEFYSPENLADVLENNTIQFEDKESETLEFKKGVWKVQNLILKKGALERFIKNNSYPKFLEKITQEQKISTLEVRIENYEISEPNLVSLFKCIQTLPALNNFIFRVSQSKLNLVNVTQILGDELKLILPLKNLTLDFSSCFNIPDHAIINLSSALAQLKNLQQLSLNFNSCYSISDQNVKTLSQAIKTLTSLEHLSVNFSYCKAITNQGLADFGDAIKELKLLAHLSLNFYRCENISDPGLTSLSESLNFLYHLNEEITKESPGETETDDPTTPETPISTSSLKHLELDFYWCANISDGGLKALSEVLKKSLSSLENLSLNFDSCQNVTDQGLIPLGEALLELTSLQNLFLNFSSSKVISDKGLIPISKGIQALSNLTKLHVRFYRCELITDDALDAFNNAVKSLGLLKDISCDFYWCENLTDKALTGLSESLKLIKNLQHLNLNFDSCYRLSDIGLTALKDTIMSLKDLVSLSLNFSSSVEISNEGLNSLPEAIGSLQNLQNLSLFFYRCKKISDKGLRNFVVALQLLPSYKSLAVTLKFRDKN